jgi:Leucine-rich repeat (LRR) protein
MNTPQRTAALVLLTALLLCAVAFAGGAASPDAALETLTLEGEAGADLAFLCEYPNLRTLTLADCPAADLSPLAGCTKLKSLSILWQDGAQSETVYDLTPLKNCTRLSSLTLSGPCTADLTPLKNIRALTSLTVQNLGVADYAPIAGLSLAYLNLSGADGGQVAAIFASAGKKLTSAAIGNCALTAEANGAILACSRLNSLRFENVTGIADEAGAWTKLTSLTTLSMNGCELKSLAFLSNFVSTVVVKLTDIRIGGVTCSVAFDKYFLQTENAPSGAMLDFLTAESCQWLYATIGMEEGEITGSVIAALADVHTLLSLDAQAVAEDAFDPAFWDGFPKLEQLKITANHGAALGFLSQLPGLKRLVIADAAVTGTDAIGGLPALSQLTLIGCTADGWAFLERLSTLEQLTVAGCDGPDDLTFTAAMPRLKALVLEDAPVTSLAALSGRKLAFVSVYGCPIETYAPLSGLPSLTVLSANEGAELPQLDCRIEHRHYIQQ